MEVRVNFKKLLNHFTTLPTPQKIDCHILYNYIYIYCPLVSHVFMSRFYVMFLGWVGWAGGVDGWLGFELVSVCVNVCLLRYYRYLWF